MYSQKIVIGSEELVGRDIDYVVRERINALEKSPKVVRSTALIIKSSKVSANSSGPGSGPASDTYVYPDADSGTIITTVIDGQLDPHAGKTILRKFSEQVSMLGRRENKVSSRRAAAITKTANGCVASARLDVGDVRNGVEAATRQERTGKFENGSVLLSFPTDPRQILLLPLSCSVLGVMLGSFVACLCTGDSSNQSFKLLHVGSD